MAPSCDSFGMLYVPLRFIRKMTQGGAAAMMSYLEVRSVSKLGPVFHVIRQAFSFHRDVFLSVVCVASERYRPYVAQGIQLCRLSLVLRFPPLLCSSVKLRNVGVGWEAVVLSVARRSKFSIVRSRLLSAPPIKWWNGHPTVPKDLFAYGGFYTMRCMVFEVAKT